MKTLIIISLLCLFYIPGMKSQPGNDTIVYLVTCGPGTETYSVYGHSAIRIVIPEKNSDVVYNWGVFDFSTPNFAWKFAKGRLEYMLGTESMKSFLQIYFFEKRFVLSQRININADETKKLVDLINENLKPENIKYRYDFFYDDCSTRIRDLLEKSVGEKLLYPPAEVEDVPTFRNMVGKYQNPYPWLDFGIDLIMGSPGDKKAFLRDRMFLPIDLKNGLSEAVISRSGKMIPLLQNPEIILDFDLSSKQLQIFTIPAFSFALLLIIIMIISSLIRNKRLINIFDIIVFSVFSILDILMIFFNFFTDHQQMKWNLNIIWLNPVILVCLILLVLNKRGAVWFRFLFYISAAFLVLHFFLPQEFHNAIIPLIIILLVRSSARAEFDWNPLSIK